LAEHVENRLQTDRRGHIQNSAIANQTGNTMLASLACSTKMKTIRDEEKREKNKINT
jgi:hypothetical protein